MKAIYKKELFSYFTSMIGWIFLAFFLVLTGLYFMIYNLMNGMTNFSYVYQGIEMLFVFLLVPVLTMRVVAEENRQKTDQLLYTAPVPIYKVILGKYFALLTLFGIGMAVTATYPLILQRLVHSVATSGEKVDFAVAYSSTLGFFLLGAAYIAIGMFISSLTESQVIAAVISGVVMMFTFLMTNIASVLPSSHIFTFWFLTVCVLLFAVILRFWTHNGWLSSFVGIVLEVAMVVIYVLFTDKFDSLISKGVTAISITDRFTNFTLGILDVSALIYYLSVCFLFVFLTVQRIKKKRYN